MTAAAFTLLAAILPLVPTVPARAQDGSLAGATLIKRGPTGCHAVAFTFDLCPVRDPIGFDAPLVELLREHHIPATFFASGRWIERHDRAVRELLGVPFFEVETHGQLHRHLPALDRAAQQAEIEGPFHLLHATYGYSATLFRPPYGEYDQTTRELASADGLGLVLWSAVSGDPSPRISSEQMLRALRATVRDGSIIIFHANGRGHHTREVVETLHAELDRAGLRSLTVKDLLAGCTVGPS